MQTREEKKTLLSTAVQDVIDNPSENHILNLIFASVKVHRQGSGLHWSETEEIVKSKF